MIHIIGWSVRHKCALSAHVKDAEARKTMLLLADDYEKAADRAAERGRDERNPPTH
jgi:hypothetical protein